ncbi:hypothetical protein BJ508DRAFT_128609 [Ascobolus immersus RN42]|uniref:Uncharacterized protein n=1 Tax=Ascobolus immersus RN42 TaxID=1160509 RepID=A0A3N4I8Q9_ASCIM|nr:hypothetical protein BJ508DRAFT_128609 [Ascobolus immersus RN42]
MPLQCQSFFETPDFGVVGLGLVLLLCDQFLPCILGGVLVLVTECFQVVLFPCYIVFDTIIEFLGLLQRYMSSYRYSSRKRLENSYRFQLVPFFCSAVGTVNMLVSTAFASSDFGSSLSERSSMKPAFSYM